MRTRQASVAFDSLEEQYRKQFPELQPIITKLVQEVLSWPEVEKFKHAYGGIEFRLFNKSFGHVHANGLVDLPFKSELREWLIAYGYAGYHHYTPNLAWVSYPLKSELALKGAIELLQLGYLIKSERYVCIQPAVRQFLLSFINNNQIIGRIPGHLLNYQFLLD